MEAVGACQVDSLVHLHCSYLCNQFAERNCIAFGLAVCMLIASSTSVS